jgi:hypothetical protein
MGRVYMGLSHFRYYVADNNRGKGLHGATQTYRIAWTKYLGATVTNGLSRKIPLMSAKPDPTKPEWKFLPQEDHYGGLNALSVYTNPKPYIDM